MLDLSVRVFYKAHFNIESKYSDVSLFDEVIYGLYNWLHHKFGQPIVCLLYTSLWTVLRMGVQFPLNGVHAAEGDLVNPVEPLVHGRASSRCFRRSCAYFSRCACMPAALLNAA